MHPYTRLLTLTVSILVAAPALFAQTSGLSGHWEGTIQTPQQDVKIKVDLVANGGGELAGTFGNPTQNLQGLVLSNFVVDGKSIGFQIKGAPGERMFRGQLSADGASISGDYTQSGYTMPFTLTRTGDARIETPAKNAPIAKELEGTWNGTLEVEGKQRQIILRMSNQPDGAVTGSFVSVDEGLEIPISRITQKESSVTLDVKAVGGSYAAAVNPEGTMLVGTWTQGPAVLPLTFQRAAK